MKSYSIGLLALVILGLVGCQTTQTADEEACSNCTYTRAYDTAKVFGDNSDRGVVVHFHGCNGLYIDNGGWQTQWVRYLNENGFIVIAPDSFADVRPPEACPGNPTRTEDRKATIYHVRTRQMDFALKQIRLKYPGKKIYVWGHSEGGALMRALTERVDGVITTGFACPGERSNYLEASPYLAIMGTDDPVIEGSKKNPLYEGLEGRCQAYMSEPNWSWLVVQGMGHPAEIWRKGVKEHLSKFLGI